MKRTDPQMRIRLPDNIKAWLAREADKNLRTQSAEIAVALREKMEAATGREIGVQNPAAAATTANREAGNDINGIPERKADD